MAERTVTIRLKLDVGDVIDRAQEAELALDRLDKKVDALGRKSADIKIDLNGMTKAMAELDLLEKKIKGLGGVKVPVRVSGSGGGTGGGAGSTGPADGGVAGALGSVLNIQPTLATVVVGSLIALSPAIAAALNAAFLETAGLGGLALGIVGQLKNPIVANAATLFGESIKGSLTSATRDFEKPIVQSLDVVKTSFEKGMNSIDFSGLSKQLVPLSVGITGALENMNIGGLLKDAEPILHEFSALLPSIGKALGDFFHEIEGSRGTMEGLRSIFLLVIGVVEVLGHVLGSLGNVFDAIIQAGEKLSTWMRMFFNIAGQIFETIGSWLKPLGAVADTFNLIGEAYHKVAGVFDKGAKWLGFLKDGGEESKNLDDRTASLTDSMTKLGAATPAVSAQVGHFVGNIKAAQEATAPLTQAFSTLATEATGLPMVFRTISDVLGTSLSHAAVTASGSLDTITADLEGKVFNALMGVKQATVGYRLAVLGLNDAVKQNGTSLDSTSKKGLQNQLVILGLAQANQQLYQANIAAGKGTEEATRIYQDNAKAMEDSAVKAGYNRDMVHGLIGQLGMVPEKTQTEIEMSGLAENIGLLADAINRLAELNGYRADAFFTVHYNQVGDPTARRGPSWAETHNQALGGVVSAASGVLAPSNPGTMILAGEPQTGGELFLPLRGISRSRAMGLAQLAGNAYGFSVGPRGAHTSDHSAKMTVIHEHHITIEGTGLMRGLRAEIKAQGGDVQTALGTR